MDDRSETKVRGPGSSNLLRTAQRLQVRAPTLRTLLSDGVADGSVQLLVDVLAEGYLCTSPEGQILRANDAMVHLTGRPLEDLVGASIEALVAEAADQRTLSTVVGGSASTIVAEMQLAAVSGEPVPVLVLVVPSHLEGGRHWLVAELETSRAGSANGTSSLEDAFQVFLHDLRSLLSVPQGFIELLLRRGATLERDRRQEALEIAMRNLLKVQDLITETRLSQRARPPETPNAVEEVDLAGLIGSILVRLDPGGTTQLTVDAPLGRQPMLHGQLVGRSMEALLEDALRHAAHETLHVALGAAGGDVVTITVDDRCTDGAEQTCEHAPSQPLTDGAAHHGGLGSGLAILSPVARAHDGRAWVEASSEGAVTYHLELRSIPLTGSTAEDTCP